MKQLVVLLLLWVVSVWPAMGVEHYSFYKVTQEADIMFPTRLSNIYEDSRGYIWLPTRSGLGKFDGYHLKQYLHTEGDPTSLPGNDVWNVNEDRHHNLWVFTVGGIAVYHYDTDKFEPLLNEEGKPIVSYGGCPWKEGMLWISAGKINYYNDTDQRVTLIAELTKDYWIEKFGLLDDNTLLCQSRSFVVFRVRLDTGEVSQDFFDCQGPTTDFYVDSQKRLWITTNNKGLHCFSADGQRLACYSKEQGNLPTSQLLAVTEVDGKIILGTRASGLLFLNPETGDIRQFQHVKGNGQFTLPGNTVSRLDHDKYGNILMGIANHGLVVFGPVYIRTFTEEGSGFGRGPYSSSVASICPQGDKVWVGTTNDGLNCFDPQTETFKRFPTTENSYVTAIADLDANRLLLSIYGRGLQIFDVHTGRMTPLQIYNEEVDTRAVGSGNEIHIRKNSPETVLVLTNKAYIYHIRENRFTLAQNDSEENYYMAFGTVRYVSSNADYTYISDRTHIYRLDHKTEVLSTVYTHKVPKELINMATETPDGIIWLATNFGVVRVDPKTKESYRIPTNLFVDVLSIQADPKEGRIWIGTYYGLYSYNPKNEHFVAYNKMDGAFTCEFIRTSTTVDGDYIYMGSVNGLMQIDYQRAVRNNSETHYDISECILNGQSLGNPFYNKKNHLEIPYRSNLFLTLLTQDRDRFRKRNYRFKVHNYSTEPVEDIDGALRLFNLHPGHYDVQVSSMLNDGRWSEYQPLGSFDVLPPWYQSWWFLGSIVTVFLIIGGGFIRYIMVRKEQSMERTIAQNQLRMNEEKIDFLVNVSHELRTPLTLIYAPLKRMLKRISPNDENYRLLQTACRQSSRMTDIINMVLDLEKMGRKAVKLQLQAHPFNAWVEEGIRDFVSEGEERGVRVVLDADKRITMVPFDIRKCDIVLNNLVMNALKHSPTGTTMTVRTLLEKDHVRVEVSDEGTGLQPGDEKELFTRFYQGAKESTGTGLGLAYSKVLLEQHKGTIGAYNNATKGATFYFTLPLIQEQVIAEAPLTEVEQKSVEQPELLEEAGTKKLQLVAKNQEKYDYTILVVDDQESITQFLHDALKESFKEILTAKDGVEAMKVLQNNRPDAVISDVMMPRMDGYELCRRIKSDLNISHIPVLLLTAKTDEHSIQVGYKTGADAYLPKPFDLEVLKQIVLNQLNTRQRVQDKYSTPGVVPLPEEVTISYADETFLKKLNELIEQHIDNTSLDIALIEMEMGMSRASIFNKMKSLTGMGCNEYITKIRMEKAIRFVKESALSFTEISERVGYNTASYFSTAFKQYTGMTPTQYRKKAKAEE